MTRRVLIFDREDRAKAAAKVLENNSQPDVAEDKRRPILPRKADDGRWYFNMGTLGQDTLKNVLGGRLEIMPE